jgi:hypothetical protein
MKVRSQIPRVQSTEGEVTREKPQPSLDIKPSSLESCTSQSGRPRHGSDTDSNAPSHDVRAGWRVPEWCRAVGFSRAKYYELEGEMKPHSILIGRSRIIVEQPEAYLQRIYQLQSGNVR